MFIYPFMKEDICIDEEEPDADNKIMQDGSGQILVVDDEEIMITIAEGILKESGYTVITANYGKAAIEIFRERWKDINAVLLDISMPGMSGKDIFSEMKKIDPMVKVILTSGSISDIRISEILSMGALDFLPKPVDIDLMRKKIKGITSAK